MESDFNDPDVAIYRSYISLRRMFKASTGYDEVESGNFDAAFFRVLREVASGDLTLVPGTADAMAKSPPPEELRAILEAHAPAAAQRQRDDDKEFAIRLLSILERVAKAMYGNPPAS
jgi:hypothetical protein